MPLTVNPVDPTQPPAEPTTMPAPDPTTQPPPYSPVSQPGVEAPEQQPPSSAQEAAQGESSSPSGEQDATMPGVTPETSTQMPKAGESTSSGGKSPLQFDPNAPAVDTIAQKGQMQVEGELDEGKSAQQQIHSSALPPPVEPGKEWQNYAVEAMNGLYPRLRNGVDWAVGRKTFDGDVELLAGEEAGVDWSKVQEAAKKLAGTDPNTNYQPKPPLHGGFAPEGSQGEVDPNRTLPGNVAQSEVNPATDDKQASQAYPPPPPTEPAPAGAPQGPAP